MSLFQGEFIFLHSGEPTSFKIDCDFLSDEDIKQLAKVISKNIEFNAVYGIPTGGTRLAEALKAYIKPGESNKAETLLIVDDVLTTGSSFKSAHEWIRKSKEYSWKGHIKGAYIS